MVLLAWLWLSIIMMLFISCRRTLRKSEKMALLSVLFLANNQALTILPKKMRLCAIVFWMNLRMN